jgi:hypothetical protein
MKTLILSAIRCSLMLLVPSVTYGISAQWDLDSRWGRLLPADEGRMLASFTKSQR